LKTKNQTVLYVVFIYEHTFPFEKNHLPSSCLTKGFKNL